MKSSEKYMDAGPYRVHVWAREWEDENRNRKIQVKAYFPENGHACPLICFSHGLGASCHHYHYLGTHWASHGYVSLHIQHPGTDWTIFQGKRNREEAMREASQNVDQVLQRPLDIRFVLDMLFQNPSGFPFSLDLSRICVAGHSMGAVTALLCGGAFFQSPNGNLLSFHDPRICACIAMSPSSKDFESSKHLYSQFRIPSLHLTGTQDYSPIGGTQLAHRRVPFDAMTEADAILIIFKGADHMAFSDSPWRFSLSGLKRKTEERRFHKWIRFCTLVFLEAYLQHNPEAKAWLFSGEKQKAIEEVALMETKQKEHYGH